VPSVNPDLASAVVGALVGFGGTLLVSLRSERVAREQIRYALAHQRQDEILETAMEHLIRSGRSFSDLLQRTDLTNSDEATQALKAFIESLMDANTYLNSRFFLLDEPLEEQIRTLNAQMLDWGVKIRTALDNSDDPSSPAMQKTLKEAKIWRKEDFNQALGKLATQIRRKHGLTA
jgi:hypothetical protein